MSINSTIQSINCSRVKNRSELIDVELLYAKRNHMTLYHDKICKVHLIRLYKLASCISD